MQALEAAQATRKAGEQAAREEAVATFKYFKMIEQSFDPKELGFELSYAEIERAAQRVHLAAGGNIAYAQLILAVGARNRPLPVPGAEHALYLRSLDEAVTLKQRLAEAQQGVIVIGGGFIGLEVALQIYPANVLKVC